MNRLKWDIYNKYTIRNIILKIPIGILGDINNHYVVYNKNGQVLYGCKSFLGAVRLCKKDNLYFSKIID